MEKIVGWQYQRVVSLEKLPALEAIIEPMADAIDVGEAPEEKGEMRRLTAFFPSSVPRAQLLSALALAEKVVGVTTQGSPISLQPLYDEDWQQKMYRTFPPIIESGFFIHGFDESVPEDKIGLHVPAGMAFGTGEHATTAMCLNLYEDLSAVYTFKNGLDMGAGSGILAIAAAKVQKTRFLAVDMDADAITACRENLVNNGVEGFVSGVVGDGCRAPGVQARQPYDLIFANILKNPLIEMAADLSALLIKQGRLILSGFNIDQREDVVKAYQAQGLALEGEAVRDDWCAVVVCRK